MSRKRQVVGTPPHPARISLRSSLATLSREGRGENTHPPFARRRPGCNLLRLNFSTWAGTKWPKHQVSSPKTTRRQTRVIPKHFSNGLRQSRANGRS